MEEKEGIEECAKTEEIRAKRTAELAEAECAVAEILFDEMISEDQDVHVISGDGCQYKNLRPQASPHRGVLRFRLSLPWQQSLNSYPV